MDSGENAGLRRCPNCLSVRLFAEPEGELVFVNIRADGSAQASRPPHAPLPELDVSLLHCTGCGWNGGPDELLPPEDAHV